MLSWIIIHKSGIFYTLAVLIPQRPASHEGIRPFLYFHNLPLWHMPCTRYGMEKHHITVFIDGRAYGLLISVDHSAMETLYEVVPDLNGRYLREYFLAEPVFTTDHAVGVKDRLHIVESEQIARIIWLEIIDKLK